jgi:hypothetical protein
MNTKTCTYNILVDNTLFVFSYFKTTEQKAT